jgi:hypothetical protein
MSYGLCDCENMNYPLSTFSLKVHRTSGTFKKNAGIYFEISGTKFWKFDSWRFFAIPSGVHWVGRGDEDLSHYYNMSLTVMGQKCQSLQSPIYHSENLCNTVA